MKRCGKKIQLVLSCSKSRTAKEHAGQLNKLFKKEYWIKKGLIRRLHGELLLPIKITQD
jgi:hypothetical protein